MIILFKIKSKNLFSFFDLQPFVLHELEYIQLLRAYYVPGSL